MMFSLTFYQYLSNHQLNDDINKKDSKEFIVNAITDHQIWKENEFWAAMILCAIRDEYISQKKYNFEMKETLEETAERVRNIVYGHLASVARNMIIFGHEKNDVTSMIMKYCKLCSIPDKHMKDLMVKFFNKLS